MAKVFKRILVPHDLSVQANRALKVAIDLAAASGGRLIVLHVVAPVPSGFGFTARLMSEPIRDLALGMKRRLEADVAEALGAVDTVPVECQVVVGQPLAAILAAARKADSIVMSTFGRTSLSRALIGSVAERVVRHATVPVLTVRPQVARAQLRRSRRRR